METKTDSGTTVEMKGHPLATGKHKFSVKLQSFGNPDFGQYAPVSNPKTVKASTLRGILKACQDYIELWNLGGGNWATPEILENGKPVAWVSYNGRIWETNPRKHLYVAGEVRKEIIL